MASFSLEARIYLLKTTLYYQQLAGVEIVSEEDLNYIKKRWYEEFGWVENEDDLRPELLDYVGALVLDEHYNVNWKESSIPNMVQSWKEDGLEETEQEIYNPDPSNPFSPVYYVTVDQGCSERELYRDIMASIKRREKSYLSIGQPSD